MAIYTPRMTGPSSGINYFSLIDTLVTQALVKQWRHINASPKQKILLLLHASYVKRLELAVKNAMDRLRNPVFMSLDSPIEDLQQHFYAMDKATSLLEVLTSTINFNKDFTLLGDLAVRPAGHHWSHAIKSGLFMLFSMIYTLPNLVVALQAEAFVKMVSGLTLSGIFFGSVFYGVNTLINFYGVWSMWDKLIALREIRLPCRCHYEHFITSAIKGVLVALFVASEIADVLAFPFTLNARYDSVIAKIQLVMTFFMATGLALLPINELSEKLQHYLSALHSHQRWQASVKPQMTTEDIDTIYRYCHLKATNLTAKIECATPIEIDLLYRQVEHTLFTDDLESGINKPPLLTLELPNAPLTQTLRSSGSICSLLQGRLTAANDYQLNLFSAKTKVYPSSTT